MLPYDKWYAHLLLTDWFRQARIRDRELKTGSSDWHINAAREKQLQFDFITTVWTEVAQPGVFVVKLQPSKIDNR